MIHVQVPVISPIYDTPGPSLLRLSPTPPTGAQGVLGLPPGGWRLLRLALLLDCRSLALATPAPPAPARHVYTGG